MSILIFLGVLFVLILVHEWGHYITAKLTGMKVEEFGIGFPPKLAEVRRGETVYTLNALPIGGFVKILGENGLPEEEGGVPAADQARAFGARPKWAQAVVLLAGVTMNVLLAWVLFAAVFMAGMPTVVDEATASPAATLRVQSLVPDGPAAAALPVGATITAVQGADRTLDTLTPTALTEFVTQVAPVPVVVTYDNGGQVATATITPAQGLVADDPERYLLGISPALIETITMTPGVALVAAAEHTVASLQAITVGLGSLLAQSIAGTADYSQVAGPVGIVGLVGDAAAYGWVALLTFTAFISLNLAVINLLPIPALDGGRLVFVAIEAVTGKTIPPEWTGRINLLGFAFLMLLMLLVTFNDIRNIFF